MTSDERTDPDQERAEEPEASGELERSQPPHNPILRSFLSIIVGVLIYLLFGFGIHAVVVWTLFPVEARVLASSGEQRDGDRPAADSDDSDGPNANPESPADAEPPYQASFQFWLVALVIHVTAGLLAGMFTGYIASYGRVGHGLLLAAFFFFSSMRRGETEPIERPDWALAAYAFGIPLAALIGAWIVDRLTRREPEESAEELQ